jgi:hypothetical protein
MQIARQAVVPCMLFSWTRQIVRPLGVLIPPRSEGRRVQGCDQSRTVAWAMSPNCLQGWDIAR